MLFDYTGRRRRRWLRIFPYTRTVIAAALVTLLGAALCVPLVETYVSQDLALDRADAVENHVAVTGLATIIVGAQLFVFTLLLHGAVAATTRRRSYDPH